MKQAVRSIGKAMDKAVDILEIFTGYILFIFMALLFI